MLLLSLISYVAGSANITGDVVVYGGTAAGCVAAIAASRSGAKNVVLASPYEHLGGMTTGGIMHADVGNASTIAGITGEYFLRVEKHYSPPTPAPPSQPSYACVSMRCVILDKGAGSPDPSCGGECASLGVDEWLAVRKTSSLSNSNKTLTVKRDTYIKKTEVRSMPQEPHHQQKKELQH
jgi:hypothetical protein